MTFITMLQEGKIISNLSVVNDFIGHVIWPFTLLIVFLIFRKQITKKMDKLNSIDASSTGISMSFEQELDEAIEEMVEAERKPKIIAKSGVRIGEEPKEERKVTPVESLLGIRDQMNQKLVKKAEASGIHTSGKSAAQLLDDLKSESVISNKEHKGLNRLLHLINAVDQNISQAQVNKVKLLFNNYSKEL